MQNLRIGDVIKARRKELGMTQEELCDGIIEPSTLSRLENNNHFPKALQLQAIISRLGLPLERFMVLTTKGEFEVLEACNDIIELNIVGEFDKAYELVCELEQTVKDLAPATLQFIKRCKLIVQKSKGMDLDDFIREMTEVIRITIPNFTEDRIEDFMLNNEELKCITNIAHAYAQKGERRHAISIYQRLLKVINKNYLSTEEKARCIPPISASLSKYLYYENRFEEAVEVADAARVLCIRRRQTKKLPDLLMNKGFAYCKLGKTEEAVALFEQAYHLFLAVENFITAHKMINAIQEEFGIVFTTLGHLRLRKEE